MARKGGSALTVDVDLRAVPLEAAQAAAYTFTDRAYARLSRSGAAGLAVRFSAKPGAGGLGSLEREFREELAREALRLKVARANQKLREFIVTKALTSAPCAEPAVAPAPAAGEPPVDAELEAEIDKLLADVEKEEPERP